MIKQQQLNIYKPNLLIRNVAESEFKEAQDAGTSVADEVNCFFLNILLTFIVFFNFLFI
jgi:hypothetical protein